MIPPINFFEHITTKQVHNNNNGEMCVEEEKKNCQNSTLCDKL